MDAIAWQEALAANALPLKPTPLEDAVAELDTHGVVRINGVVEEDASLHLFGIL